MKHQDYFSLTRLFSDSAPMLHLIITCWIPGYSHRTKSHGFFRLQWEKRMDREERARRPLVSFNFSYSYQLTTETRTIFLKSQSCCCIQWQHTS